MPKQIIMLIQRRKSSHLIGERRKWIMDLVAFHICLQKLHSKYSDRWKWEGNSKYRPQNEQKHPGAYCEEL